MRLPDFAPRAISLDHNLVIRNCGRNFQIRLCLQRASVDANIQSHIDQLLCLLQSAVKSVHHAALDLIFVLGQDFNKVIVRTSTVQEEWQPKFVGEIELPFEISVGRKLR